MSPTMDLKNMALVPIGIALGWMTAWMAFAVAIRPWIEGNDLAMKAIIPVGIAVGAAIMIGWIERVGRRRLVRVDGGGLHIGGESFAWGDTRFAVEEMDILTDTGERFRGQVRRVLLIETPHGVRALVPRDAAKADALLDRIAVFTRRKDSPSDVPGALGRLAASA